MTSLNQRRVVLTGLGSITNLGHDVISTWSGLLEGRSGIGQITSFEQDDRWTTRIAGEISDWDPSDRLDHNEIKKMDRFHGGKLIPWIENKKEFYQGEAQLTSVFLDPTAFPLEANTFF